MGGRRRFDGLQACEFMGWNCVGGGGKQRLIQWKGRLRRVEDGVGWLCRHVANQKRSG